MSDVAVVCVDPALVEAAIRAAERGGQDVADVPLTVLAKAAGISRSTLVRRLGGSRRSLDAAVRAAGVDPGGRVPVRDRAVDAAARLISERGLAAATLEAVASAAGCSVHSLYVTFAGRDGLLTAVYESSTPLFDVEELLAGTTGDPKGTVNAVYRAFAVGLTREPRVAPAMLADALSHPDGAAARLVGRYFPRAMSSLGAWLTAQASAGRICRMPEVLLIQQFLGPLVLHLLSRPVMQERVGLLLPDLDEVCAGFTEAFVRAVGTSEVGQLRREREV